MSTAYEQKTQNHAPTSTPRQDENAQRGKEEQRGTESQQTTPEWSQDSRSPRLINGVRFEECGCCIYQQVFITPATGLIRERYVFGMVKAFTCRSHAEQKPRRAA